ncbi:MAG TPA: DUF2156 domain-containing protein [Candidatus Avacidaminococcus intestinavium]|uniref:DUF2156 domain-containing protein n=1 Tax=Candidatus Avacidaminococcus intestinavium TaxID=2840684 RepID=A0A9D1SM42_9FIRM|nr:DUF2156 domain-containing protein [Candidatus Avacidaminococcus intestinavium]
MFSAFLLKFCYNYYGANQLEGLSILEFKNIELQDKEIFDAYFTKGYYQGSECTFTNLFVWRTCYKIRWAISYNSLIIKVTRSNTTFILPPFGANPKDLPAIFAEIKESFHGESFQVRGIYEEQVPILEEFLHPDHEIIEDRDNWDYVYDRDSLATLAGRKYHSKKNHVNAFRKEHPNYEFSIIKPTDIEECIAFADLWCEKKGLNDDGLRCELCAVEDALRHYDILEIKGGLIRINGKVEAFTIAENLNKDMAVVHFEKANADIRGLYTVINQDFVSNVLTDVKYINREEDMGIEGLRTAKESYKPVFMTKKYTLTI